MHNLSKLFDRAYKIIFEADQSKMTSSQVKKDIENRNKAQTIGIEIELYSELNIKELYEYLDQEFNVDGEASWDVDNDPSLMDRFEVKNSYNDLLLDNPIEAVNDQYGASELTREIDAFLNNRTNTYTILNNIKNMDDEDEINQLISLADYKNVVELLYSNQDFDFPTTSNKLVLMQTVLDEDQETYEDWLKDEYRDENDTFADENDLAGKYGVEIKFAFPRKLNNLDSIMNEINEIAEDDYIDASYYDGNKGATGLHVHFGLSQHEPTNLDILRLVINAYEKSEDILQYAQREYNHFAESLKPYIENLNKVINKEIELENIKLPSGKSDGMTYLHRSGKGTVEFRWASSSIVFTGDLRKYIEILVGIINDSFTGSDELQYKDVTIKEVSKGAVGKNKEGTNAEYVIIKNGKIIKRAQSGDYSNQIKSKAEKRTEKYNSGKKEIEDLLVEYESNKKKLNNYLKIKKTLLKKLFIDEDEYNIDELKKLLVKIEDPGLKKDVETLIKILMIENKISPMIKNQKSIIDNKLNQNEMLQNKLLRKQ